jgi:lipopolysaccharide biosynthesis glycosyltransferase
MPKSQLGIPLVKRYGINSGVLFLRLDKLRKFELDKKMMQTLDLWIKKPITAEQDLLNILFSNQTGTKYRPLEIK